MSCWPVAAGLEGVVRAAARSENSDEVFADCSWIFAPTGPFAKFWVIGWFLTALAAAEASTKIVSFASLCFPLFSVRCGLFFGLLFQVSVRDNKTRELRGMHTSLFTTVFFALFNAGELPMLLVVSFSMEGTTPESKESDMLTVG